MSISDRLDQIERESVEANEQWDCGRSAFNADNHAPPIDAALVNGERTLAAVRAVLDACDRIDASIIPSGDFEVGQKSVTQTVRMIVEHKLSTVPSAAESARAIATALGEDRHVDQ